MASAVRVLAAHLVLAAFVVQGVVAAWLWIGAPSAGAEESAAPAPTAWQFAGYGTFMVACATPYPFLRSLDHPRLHAIGRWSALLLGWLCILGIFWAVQGVLLVAAFVWANVREKPLLAAEPGQPAPAERAA